MEGRWGQDPPKKRRDSVQEDQDVDSLDGEEVLGDEISGGSVISASSSTNSDDVDAEEDPNAASVTSTSSSSNIQTEEEGVPVTAPVEKNIGKAGKGEEGQDKFEIQQLPLGSEVTEAEGGDRVYGSILEEKAELQSPKKEEIKRQKKDKDENSVDLEEREAPPHRSRRRSSQQENEQLWNTVRKGVRKSLEVPKELSPLHRFGITKENFLQQKVPILWQPLWTCRSVGRLLLILSIITLPLSLLVFFTQTNAQEHRFTFGEECLNSRNYLRLVRSVCIFCGGYLNPDCSKVIFIPEDMKTPVYLYYELVGFNQNHRTLVNSVDNNQLWGKIFLTDGKAMDPDENCGKRHSKDENGKVYFPCGELANLMYNDDFSLATSNGALVPFRTRGIALNAMKSFLFRNPPGITPSNYKFKEPFTSQFVKPRDWTVEMYEKWWKGGGMENERFMNWMNPSARAHFRKLYAVIDNVPTCPPGLFCKGKYTMNIEYRFDIERYGGNKAFVLATATFFGAQNYFIPIILGVIGIAEFALGHLLLQMNRLKTAEVKYHQDQSPQRRRRSSSERRRRRTSQERDHTAGNIYNVSPQTSPVGASESVSVVTRISTSQESNSSSRKPRAEGLMLKPVYSLYRNPLSPEQSREVLPDHNGETDDSDLTTYYNTTTDEEEQESGDSVTESFSSHSSPMVSAAEDTSLEEEEPHSHDEVDFRQ